MVFLPLNSAHHLLLLSLVLLVLFSKNNLNHFLSKKKEWDVLLLGGNNTGYFIQENPYSCRISACQTTTGYLLKNHYYDTLLNNMKEGLKKPRGL